LNYSTRKKKSAFGKSAKLISTSVKKSGSGKRQSGAGGANGLSRELSIAILVFLTLIFFFLFRKKIKSFFKKSPKKAQKVNKEVTKPINPDKAS